MADLLSSAMTWLSGQRRKSLAREVVYVSGSKRGTVLAAVGQTQIERQSDTGISSISDSRDYIINREDLLLADATGTTALHEPVAGDVIKETINGKVHTYRVLAMPGVPVAMDREASKVSVRIHTKFDGISA